MFGSCVYVYMCVCACVCACACAFVCLTIRTKGMWINAVAGFVDGVLVCDQSEEMMREFPYLGNIISEDCEVDCDVEAICADWVICAK